METEHMSLELIHQVARLEFTMRRLKLTCWCLALTLVILLSVSASPPQPVPDVITAKKFVLVDNAGHAVFTANVSYTMNSQHQQADVMSLQAAPWGTGSAFRLDLGPDYYDLGISGGISPVNGMFNPDSRVNVQGSHLGTVLTLGQMMSTNNTLNPTIWISLDKTGSKIRVCRELQAQEANCPTLQN